MSELFNSDHFIVEPSLLEKANEGDGEAQYQIGIQALSEGRFGFARVFFKLAHRQNHPLAWKYYLIAQDALIKQPAETLC